MAFGSRGHKDFGLTTNMTLPLVVDPSGTPGVAYMPEEKKGKRKKHARFAPEVQEQIAPAPAEPEVKRSWAHRFKGIFRRSKKSETPYAVATPQPPPPPDDDVVNDDEDLVKIIESDPPVIKKFGSDPDLRRDRKGGPLEEKETNVQDGQEEGSPRKKKSKTKKSSRKTKSLSTALEHITPVQIPATSSLNLVIKPRSSTSGSRKVVLEQRKGLEDGFGMHLSGGLPPVTVTYVKPGGQAELAGVEVGDVILDVNGLNCKKKVDLARIMELKMLVQQQELEQGTAEQIDAATWDKIQARQYDLDLEASSEVKITSIDSTTDEEPTSPPPAPVEVKIRKKNGKKRLSSTRSSGGEFGDPLAASSPFKDEGQEADVKSKKKKRSSRSSIVKEDEKEKDSGDITNTSSTTERKGSKKSSKRSSTSSITAGEHEVSLEAKKKKKKTSKSNSSVSEDVSKSPSSDTKVVQAEINDSSQERARKKPITEDVDGPRSTEIDRSDRHRRSSSPKSRYRMGEGVPELEAEPEPEIVSDKKRKKSKTEDTKKSEGDVKKKKKSKSKEEASEKKVAKKKSSKGEAPSETPTAAKEKETKKKRKSSKGEAPSETPTAPKEKETKKKRKSSKGEAPSETPTEKETKKKRKSSKRETTLETPTTMEQLPLAETSEPPSADLDPSSPQSAAISGSIESNTLTFMAARGSKNSLHSLNEGESSSANISKGSSNTLPRRKSVDSGQSLAFREELREASRSQHDIKEAGNSSITIDIDPNIKVKKSGLIKEGKTPLRPSIFDQSSSPEPEQVTPISSGAVEDNILDSEFKMKKSGIVVGRKTSSSSRPSILDDEQQQSKTSPNDIQPGEMKYNRKVSEDVDMDISAIPEISPTLGLVAGRDRLSATNRSLTKRRPASLRQSLLLDSKEGEIMGTQRVELTPNKNGFAGAGAHGGSRTAAARKLFESKQPEKSEPAKFNSRFTKSVEKPVKTVSAETPKKPAEIREDKKTTPSTVTKPWSQTTSPAKDSEKGTPSWVSIAQGRQKKASMIEEKTPTKVLTVSATVKEVPTPTSTSGKEVPEMGHVAKRLAMFQKS